MTIRVIYESRLVPRNYQAFVLYPFMLFRQRKSEVSDRLFRHEWEHVDQVWRIGWLKFYCVYLWYHFTEGYESNPFEIEAKAVEDEPLTPIQRYHKEK